MHTTVLGIGLVYRHKPARDSVGCEVWIRYLRYPNKGSFLCRLAGSRAVRLPLQGQQPCANTRLRTSHTPGISHGTAWASMCSRKWHKSQQIHKNPVSWSQVKVSKQEDAFTMGEEGLQSSCQASVQPPWLPAIAEFSLLSRPTERLVPKPPMASSSNLALCPLG